MEVRTCEEYVLGELEFWRKRAEEAQSAQAVLTALKEIFFVEIAPDTGAMNIGVREEKLDRSRDAGAAGRLALLEHLFGVQGAPQPGVAGASSGGPSPVGKDGVLASGDLAISAEELAASMAAAGVESSKVGVEGVK